MTIPKTVALPLGDTPRKSCFMYRCAFETAEVYLCHIFHFGKSFFITLKMPTSRVGISPKKDRPPLIRELKQPQSDSLIMIKGEHRYSDDLALTPLKNQSFSERNAIKFIKNIRQTMLFPAKTNPERKPGRTQKSNGHRNTVWHRPIPLFNKKKNYCYKKMKNPIKQHEQFILYTTEKTNNGQTPQSFFRRRSSGGSNTGTPKRQTSNPARLNTAIVILPILCPAPPCFRVDGSYKKWIFARQKVMLFLKNKTGERKSRINTLLRKTKS